MKLYYKKFLIIAIFFILLLFTIGITIFFNSHSITKPSPTELISNDNSFRLIIPGEIEFERKNSSTLDIYSIKDEMVLTSNVIFKENEINLSDAINVEMASLSNTKTELANLSELTKLDLKNYEAYAYNYTYFDSDYNDTFYAKIVWISTDTNIYVLDLEVVMKNKEHYMNLFDSIINSFEEKI